MSYVQNENSFNSGFPGPFFVVRIKAPIIQVLRMILTAD